jgi:hypothetical protein
MAWVGASAAKREVRVAARGWPVNHATSRFDIDGRRDRDML